ncbi:hypothetical protein FRC12_018872 [Ceratobasidium sp. 428]|nr:hypothetical protein FRC12_018872 [Ceratobasidium sp. 428]
MSWRRLYKCAKRRQASAMKHDANRRRLSDISKKELSNKADKWEDMAHEGGTW